MKRYGIALILAFVAIVVVDGCIPLAIVCAVAALVMSYVKAPTT